MEELTINEVAKRAGIRASNIRYYESVQLLPPQRSAGRRRYTPEVLRQLSFIQVAQAAGLTIAEIQTLIEDPPFELARRVHQTWITFAETGDPGWAPFSAQQHQVMRINTAWEILNDPRPIERHAWDGAR